MNDDKIIKICKQLSEQGYDLSDDYDVIYGLQQLGYRRSDAIKLCKQIQACNKSDVKSAIDTGMQYWYRTTHGVGPGSVPKGIDILDVITRPWGECFFLTNKLLTTEELNRYDIQERVPKEHKKTY